MAGLIGAVRTSRRGAAVGVWTLDEQVEYQRQGTWIGDASFDSVSLLLHMDGSNGSTTFTDSSRNALTVTASGTAQISTAQSKFGGSSGYFNGTSDSLSFTDPALGTGDFTIEMWIKTNSSVQYAQLIGNETSTLGYSLLINNNTATGGQIALYRGSLIASTSTGDWSDDSWHHVAVTRSGTSVTIWVDGTSNGTGTSSASMNGASLCYVGRNNQFSPRNLVGYIDDLRITKGVARYTANFTAPSAPFSNS